jgi:tRNA threonylcarbamoyl adenosine modification protein YjeE
MRLLEATDERVEVSSSQLEDTWEAGRALARALGDRWAVIGLEGELGAGKTAFTRGFVGALAPDAELLVASPTYAICHTYRARPALHHMDLYRLSGEDDLESTGFRDLVERSVLLIEWPSCVPSVAELIDYRVSLAHGNSEDERQITMTVTGRGDRGVIREVADRVRARNAGARK